MSMVPVVASISELPDAITYANDRPNCRWYVSRRALALGRPDLVPDSWGAAITAGIKPTADHLKASRRKLGAVPSWPVPTGRPGLAQSLAADAEHPVFESQLQDLGALTDQQLSELAGEITQAFEAADVADDLAAMEYATERIGAVRAEADRRGLSLDAPPRPVTAAGTGTRTPPAPRVAADRQPRGVSSKQGGNTVMAASGIEPAWVSMLPADPLAGKRGQRTDAETATLIAAATAADQKMRQEADAAALIAAFINIADVRWEPFRWLVEACALNEAAPAWAATTLANALIGPAATIGPLTPDEQLTAWAPPLGSRTRDHRVSWHIALQLAGDRANPTPDPALAVRASFPSPECSWVAHNDEALLVALLALQPEPDLTAVVRDNRLIGDAPTTRLAAMLLGPGRTERGLPNDTLAHYGPGSRLETFAAELRGHAPAPLDATVLDSLSNEQRAALAALVTATP